uniref:Uncharacterized protein n=1 Tax=Eutreptiella gymnastica TaxID=73025 RepID=A0A7S4G7G3_9EUGL|mmetsp:Transcript_79878/g.133716  ORF Transcript_79878/g.133716 Transcript_79878/m.133716 type:complete len:137 (+) Transcript_79878:52-462(+)
MDGQRRWLCGVLGVGCSRPEQEMRRSPGGRGRVRSVSRQPPVNHQPPPAFCKLPLAWATGAGRCALSVLVRFALFAQGEEGVLLHKRVSRHKIGRGAWCPSGIQGMQHPAESHLRSRTRAEWWTAMQGGEALFRPI